MDSFETISPDPPTKDYNFLLRENTYLKLTLKKFKEEIDRLKTPPLLVCELKQHVGNKVVIRTGNNQTFLAETLQGVKDLNVGDYVLVEQKNLVIVDKLNSPTEYNAEKFIVCEKPKTKWGELGGLSKEIQEIKEVIELPLTNPQLFEKIGIDPPKGILLHGPPGCGKTCLARAVANSTNATFIKVVASELVQKYIGEGAKLVKEVFNLAKQKSPAIIFIDEIDALASERLGEEISGEKEVQRTMMQLLSEIDGFDNLSNVKIIAATNRPDMLDRALLRPGRLDRMIEVGHPSLDSRKEILQIHTDKMLLNNVDLPSIAEQTGGLSGAELKAICVEAGYFAIREKKCKINHQHFLKAVKKVKAEEREEKDYLNMFG
ncbi:AAA family ATPase [Candidatus Woesearchaeota archaeon]|nr:AAA family ATPase [Candidatus Woesearchaeota archaeon]